MLKADHSQLKTGNPPDETPRFGPLVAKKWAELHVDETDRPNAIEGGTLRASYAGRCSREIGYRIAKVAPSEPTTLSGYWRMGLGQLVHDLIQPILEEAFPGAEIERLVDWRESLGLNGGSHIDAYLVTGEKRTVIEVKSVNGFKFKKKIGARGPAEGPDPSALLQAAISAKALGADEIVIVCLSLENLSPREADKLGTDDVGRFCAEWTYTAAEVAEITDREIIRLGAIDKIVAEGGLPPRFAPIQMPSGARVTDPEHKSWTLERGGHVLEAGEYFGCDYCDFRSQCVQDGPS